MLLGTTAVVRLKSPLAHGSYSKTIKDAPCPKLTRKKGADAKYMDACFSPLDNKRYAQQRKVDTWDFTTLGHGGPPSQTAVVQIRGLAGENTNDPPSPLPIGPVYGTVDKPWINGVPRQQIGTHL